MKASTIHELKREISQLDNMRLQELILSMAKFKKDNKELLTYLLSEAHNIPGFIQSIKDEMDLQFEDINHLNLYYIKKSLRKILRNTNKYIRYIKDKRAEADLLIYFCRKIKAQKIPLTNGTVLSSLYNNQIKKINKAIATLHEDLQYDYSLILDEL